MKPRITALKSADALEASARIFEDLKAAIDCEHHAAAAEHPDMLSAHQSRRAG